MLSDVPSAPRFLVDVFSFVVHAEFEVGILQRIFISQTTDFHFANYRQIFISQTTDFHFVSSHCVSCRFVSQTTESQIIRHDGGLKIANQPFAKQPSLHLSGLRDKFYIYRQVLYIVKSFIFFNKFYIFCNEF